MFATRGADPTNRRRGCSGMADLINWSSNSFDRAPFQGAIADEIHERLKHCERKDADGNQTEATEILEHHRIGPWATVVAYLVVGLGQEGAEGPPGFVYGIIFTLFMFFNTFAINQWLQYRKKGRWTDYLVGERTYITLSLIAKTLLAWQIFANVLIPT
ncbi:heliorhodopsin HeR [Acidimicrobiales bacterium]|nr:heliorhodopsin HeR [Acidimicrobiales bacterium]